jgi:hypothetical protein
MATVYEMPHGTSGKSGGTGSLSAVTYMRKWKLIKAAPNEVYNAPQAIGVDIGSQFPGDTVATCVALDDQPDGDSRMVRIITARYESPQNTGKRDNENDNNLAPDVRPPRLGIDSSFEMAPTNQWVKNPAAATAAQEEVTAFHPNGELVSGLMKPVRSITFTYTQFNSADPSALAGDVGKVNSAPFVIQGVTYPKRTLLLKSVSSKPTVTDWGGSKYAGWTTTVQIAYRENFQWVIDETLAEPWSNVKTEIGWDMAVPLKGMNVLNDDSTYPTDSNGYNLLNTELNGVVVDAAGPIPYEVGPLGQQLGAFWAGTTFPQKGSYANADESLSVKKQIGKAQVIRQTSAGTWEQTDSNEPIPLNPDGTPRLRYNKAIDGLFPPEQAILAYRRSTYLEFDFATLGLR